MIREIKGDLIELAYEGQFDMIAHGCNCMCAMDAGIAKQIKENFPEACAMDQRTKPGDRSKLGTCTHAQTRVVGRDLIIVNAYTQYDYKGSGVLVDYQAVRTCMQWIKKRFAGKKIGLPKIGTGLARGDWGVINKIISEELESEDVVVVSLNKESFGES